MRWIGHVLQIAGAMGVGTVLANEGYLIDSWQFWAITVCVGLFGGGSSWLAYRDGKRYTCGAGKRYRRREGR